MASASGWDTLDTQRLRQMTNPRADDQLGGAIFIKVSQHVITGGQSPGSASWAHSTAPSSSVIRAAAHSGKRWPRRTAITAAFASGGGFPMAASMAAMVFLWRFTPLSQTIFEPCEDV
jgi:hypothetical protein